MQAAQNVSQVFLGVNLKCASCHDSFINNWTLADSYALANVFADQPLEIHRCNEPTGKFSDVRFLRPEMGAIDAAAKREERMARLAEILTSRQDGRFARTIVNRLWAKFFGRGMIEPVDEMDNPAWNADLLDALACDLVDHDYNLDRTIELMLASAAYQLPSTGMAEQTSDDFAFRGPVVRRLSAEQFVDALMTLTGAWYEKSYLSLPKPSDQQAARIGVRAAEVPADALLVALGRPNREQVVTSRTSTATTLEALELTNGATLAKMLAQGAERYMTAEKQSTEAIVSRIYREACGREPTAEEVRDGAELIGSPATKEGVEDLLWLVTMLPEFQLIQ
jgi:hypothetical protein